MKNRPIRYLIILAAISMASIVITQVYWISTAINNQEEQFNRSVQMALHAVVESLCEINGNDYPNNPIDQLSNNYFIARTNYKIDLKSLDYLLRAELQKRNIDQDYEYGVYDCQTNSMVYGDFVTLKNAVSVKPEGKLPKLVKDEYYFGVSFPGRKGGLVNSPGIWKIISGLTLLILIIFTYALFIILKQKRLSEIQRDFINNMTHEFKTPLSTLQISAEVLAQESTNDRQKNYAEIIRSETERLQQHINQLLETARLDEGQKPTVKTRINVNSTINLLLDRIHPINNGREIEFQQEANDLYVKGDPMIFETMVFNLLDNALKYGQSNIRIMLSSTEKYVSIAIENEGPPISKTDQQHLFEKFYRVNTGNIHDVKGFGLGLYFVKTAIQQFDGKVTLHSVDTHHCFTLQIPRA